MNTIGDLIEIKKIEETTLALNREIKYRPQETVKTYVFTDSIRENYEKILDNIVDSRGGGFWVQAEYGAGKTHFIATLSCLLMNNSESLWNLVQDERIRNYRFKLASSKLFPVLINLRGESSIDEGEEESLLEIIERHIRETLRENGLEDKVSIATADELIKWFNNCSSDLKNAVNSYMNHIGINQKNSSPQQIAKAISGYCEKERIAPKISKTTKDRLQSIYTQLISQGYHGLLFVIDEFATRQMKYPEESKEHVADEEVLETIGWVLPKELGLNVFIFVASQKSAPTKLKEDRFKSITLLADKTSQEYDIIAAHRIRTIKEAAKPEVEQYYRTLYNRFKSIKKIDKSYFMSIFPFHPLCFEAIRNITKRELPTQRAGINILHTVLSNKTVLGKTGLVTVDDLIIGLLPKELEAVIYQKAYKSYRQAQDELKLIQQDKEDYAIAEKTLNCLFAWNLAYLDQNRHLSTVELSEMQLVYDDIMGGAGLIEAVLLRLTNELVIGEIEYIKEKGAIFKVTGTQTVKPVEIFNKIVKKYVDQNSKIASTWEESLVLLPTQTAGHSSLFSGYQFDQKKKIIIGFRRTEYPGEVVLLRNWKPEYGDELRGDIHFRIVILSKKIQLDAKAVRDKRICVCIPDELGPREKEVAVNYLAITEMEKDNIRNRDEPGFEDTNHYISTKKRNCIDDLIDTQLMLFRKGQILTQQFIAMDEKIIFASESLERIFNLAANKVLSNAYQIDPLFVNSSLFKKTFSTSDAKKVFDGFFKKEPTYSLVSAVENFGPGLGLSKIESPKEFSPTTNQIFSFLRNKLELGNYEISISKVYQDLTSPPYGLTKDMVTLELLCFVRYGDPCVEIRLRGNNTAMRNSHLTAFDIPQIDWKGNIETDFDILSRSSDTSWNDVVAYGRALLPSLDLKTATKPEEILEQDKRLIAALRELKEKIPRISSNVDLLWRTFGLSFQCPEIIEKMSEICKASNYSEFYNLAKSKCSDNIDTFKQHVEELKNLEILSDYSSALISNHEYIEHMRLSTSKPFNNQVLENIESRLNPQTLVNNPSSLNQILKEFKQYKAEYQVVYSAKHQDYRHNLSILQERLNAAKDSIAAIHSLNKLTNNLPILNNEYLKLLENTRPCDVVDPVIVTTSPICNHCKVNVNDKYNNQEVDDFLSKVTKTSEQGMGQFKKLLTSELLELDKEKVLTPLLLAINSNDTDAFMKQITNSKIDYILKLIGLANIVTVTFSASKFFKKLDSIDEGQIEKATLSFKNELSTAIESARKLQPGKKIRITFGD